MDIAEIFRQLPPLVAEDLQVRLEDCAVSIHLTPDEAKDIVDEVVKQMRADMGRVDSDIDFLLGEVSDAVVTKIFS
jgi:polyhydroxyalkanoate synthesis regulator phasin